MLSSGTKEARILRLKDGFRQMKIVQEKKLICFTYENCMAIWSSMVCRYCTPDLARLLNGVSDAVKLNAKARDRLVPGRLGRILRLKVDNPIYLVD